ncbi:FAD-dependent oxidoreductase [Candidatus Woesearchaeota archaeon]|nr:FAD-dependent oxidoreductase [Candidatus Woesearchaeota archaeon]
MKRVMVLGAGITGLSVATNLASKGFDVVVLEKEKHAGGLSASIPFGEYVVEYGPHTFHTVFDELLLRYKGLAGRDFVKNRLDRQINFRGKYFKYPLQFTNILLNIPMLTSAQCFFSFSKSLLLRKLGFAKERNAEEWLTSYFGKELYNIYFKDYTTKVWGVSPSKLSKTFVSQRIPKIKIREIIMEQFKKRTIKMRKGDHIYAPNLSHIYYTKKGCGKIIDELSERLAKHNGRIYFGTALTALFLKDNKVSQVGFTSGKKQHQIDCDYLVSTIPLNDLLLAIRPGPGKRMLEASRFLRYRAVTVIAIVLSKNRAIGPQWIYFRDKTFNRLTEPKNYGLSLPKGKTILYLEMASDGKNVSAKDKENLVRKVVSELVKERIIRKDEVLDSFIIHAKHAYPIYAVGFEKNLSELESYIESIENLYSTGRQGLFKYVDMDICMRMADIVANQIAGQKMKEQVFITSGEKAFI